MSLREIILFPSHFHIISLAPISKLNQKGEDFYADSGFKTEVSIEYRRWGRGVGGCYIHLCSPNDAYKYLTFYFVLTMTDKALGVF